MLKRFCYRVFCGFFLGLSVFAPGFSGSVVAIILGIYQDLVRIVSNPFRRFKRNVIFCIPLGIGAALSALLFLLLFRYLFDRYEKATYLLFVGLIAGNLPLVFKEIKACGFRKRYLAGGGAAFAAALALGLFAAQVASPAGAQGVYSGLPVFALGGFLGGVTALVPGMSVSMVLIICGVYSQLIFAGEALLHLQWGYLLPVGVFGACAVVGLVLASRGIKFVFERHPGFANSMVFGFMAGSLLGVLSKSLQLSEPGFSWLLGGGMLAAGLGVSMGFVLLGRKLNAEGSD